MFGELLVITVLLIIICGYVGWRGLCAIIGILWVGCCVVLPFAVAYTVYHFIVTYW